MRCLNLNTYRYLSKYFLIIFTLLLTSFNLYGDIRLNVPKPRTTNDGLKSPPCGNIARTASATTYKPGETITVNWDETIDHPGWYTISFSKDGDLGFSQNILLDKIQDKQKGNYSATVTLPDTTCEACTLQLIQAMTENPANPSYYYACADIKLVADGGTVTPTAEPSPNSTQGVKLTEKGVPILGGCGRIFSADINKGNGGGAVGISLFLFIGPLLILFWLWFRVKESDFTFLSKAQD